MEGSEDTAEAVSMEQGQHDETSHVHVGGIARLDVSSLFCHDFDLTHDYKERAKE